MRAKNVILVMSLLCLSFMAGNAQSVLIKNSSMDVLYRGVKNPVSIVTCANDGEPTISSGKIYSGNVPGFEGQYIVEITDPNVKTVAIRVGEDSCLFKVLGIPTPTISIGGYRSGEDIPKAAFSNSKQIDAHIHDALFPFKVECTVTQFTYMKEEDGITSAQVVTGNKIPDEILNDIKKKSSGSSIAFIGIKVSTPAGPKNAPGFTAKLK